MTRPSSTSTGLVARLGFGDTARVVSLAASPVLAGLADPTGDATGLLRALSHVADPDQGLLGLVRLLEAADRDPAADPAGLRQVCATDGPERDRLLAVLGASSALADHLERHPDHWPEAARPSVPDAPAMTAQLVEAVSAPERGGTPGPDALRVAYRRVLVAIAARDVSSEDPIDTYDATARALADLAAAALEASLALACEQFPDDAAVARLAVLGMGKTGGRELNYISDVDVVFVVEPAEGTDADEAAVVAAGTRLASELMRICSASTGEGSLWQVDAALRPEGKQGPLVRTVASHVTYYRRWAKTWEFQALLKARHVAGDAQVAQAYLDAISPMVWEAASREHFVEDTQAMRRRVEAHLPRAEAGREIKLGVGGLRDIEFAAQLLQLVHGRTDPTLRVRGTVEALGALTAGGYVAREDTARLLDAYRWLRSLEHRIQLFKLRRTHLMPTSETDLRRLGRSLGMRTDPAEAVTRRWRDVAREVRRIHESLFYRPLLAAVARLSSADARLTTDAARDRLAALGYRDPAGALRHLEALTSGTSRAATIQRTLLPVMLGWFADEADPDAGLLAFRQVSESLGTTPWYLRMLRDEGKAAERLAHVLARSRYAVELLTRAPESVRILGEDAGLHPRSREAVEKTMRSAVARKDAPEAALEAARVVRRQELFRIALGGLVGELDDTGVAHGLTDLTEALLAVALDLAVETVGAQRGTPVPADIALIGMGRLGGREIGFSSDADVVVVHRAHEGADPESVAPAVTAVVQELRRMLRQNGPDPSVEVDVDLRPEGKNGPLSRTLEGYRGHYDRWADTWEFQALLRARPVAGDAGLGSEFVAMADEFRYAPDVLDDGGLKDVRRLKARMEAERLPRGADPKTHLKLGRGGLSDVEWTVQLLQMQHAHAVPALRTTSTQEALSAARSAALLDAADADALADAWHLASSLRNAIMLWKGRPSDSVPQSVRDAEGVHRIVGGDPGTGVQLAERWRRSARRARVVTERVFYGLE